jgi:hypothetical protein
MLTMRELVIADDNHTGPVVTVTDGEQTTRYRAAAAHFEDATTFRVNRVSSRLGDFAGR